MTERLDKKLVLGNVKGSPMKSILTRHALLCVFCVLTLEVTAMDMKYRRSSDEIRAELYSTFPAGTHRTEVISMINSKLEIDDSNIKLYSYGDRPFRFDRDGEKMSAYSRVSIVAARYRRLIFVKVAVVVVFLFDRDDRLNEIKVDLQHDSL